jgi:hypothetical protein
VLGALSDRKECPLQHISAGHGSSGGSKGCLSGGCTTCFWECRYVDTVQHLGYE